MNIKHALPEGEAISPIDSYRVKPDKDDIGDGSSEGIIPVKDD